MLEVCCEYSEVVLVRLVRMDLGLIFGLMNFKFLVLEMVRVRVGLDMICMGVEMINGKVV